ncbi:hypothetical protein PFISCL1PPCAC_22482 [Pristionchus fissidentatus]|uniref:Uncharacterized protein n=1 Tax=Pristionchus fissidentatus TaxID=1538716 RepID=A0AAV5WKX1_9BILA|nr:hypothetical protein PFISCL1PPCAC_22482 [Pristionchus fissidentatus]
MQICKRQLRKLSRRLPSLRRSLPQHQLLLQTFDSLNQLTPSSPTRPIGRSRPLMRMRMKIEKIVTFDGHFILPSLFSEMC